MRAVVDTNVLVSGLLSPHGVCAEVLRKIFSAEVEICFDARISAEYAEVLSRKKFHIDPERTQVLLDYVATSGILATAPFLSLPLPDPDDEMFLQVAIATRSQWLITGNRAHFPVDKSRGIRVVSPREFLDAIGSQTTDRSR